MATELHEFELIETSENVFVYMWVTAYVFPDSKSAHQYVAQLLLENGMGEGVESPWGLIPGRAWTTVEVNDVETLIRAGRNLQGTQPDQGFKMPDDPSEPLPPDDGVEEDEDPPES